MTTTQFEQDLTVEDAQRECRLLQKSIFEMTQIPVRYRQWGDDRLPYILPAQIEE
jgi:hypothetical protein